MNFEAFGRAVTRAAILQDCVSRMTPRQQANFAAGKLTLLAILRRVHAEIYGMCSFAAVCADFDAHAG